MIAILFLSLILSIAPLCSSYAGDRAGNGGDTGFTSPVSYMILDGDADHIVGYTVCYGQEYVRDRVYLCKIFSDPDMLNSRQRDFRQYCCVPGSNIDVTP